MSYIIGTNTASGVYNQNTPPYRGNLGGGFYLAKEDWSGTPKRIFLPPSCSNIDAKPSATNYGNRQYLVGAHTAMLLIDEDFRCNRQSISAPGKPTVSAGAGTTSQIGYLRFYDEVTKERSPLSEGTSFTGNTTRNWTALPTEVPNEQVVVEGTVTVAAGVVTGVKSNFDLLRPGDRIADATATNRWAQIRSIPFQTSMTIDDTGMAIGAGGTIVARPVSRVSHIELWLAVNGALPRLVLRVRLGTTSVSESTATLALGEAETTSFTAMPFGTMAVFYNDRQLVAGVDGHRDTVYLSAIGFPERYEGLAFVTPYNEPITGLFRYRDYVVILCADSSYRLQGYTVDDYVRTVLSDCRGGFGHLVNRVVDGKAFVPSRRGIQVFNGAFHDGIPTRQTEWQQDYDIQSMAYESGFAVCNPADQTYQLFPKDEYVQNYRSRALVYVGEYGGVGPNPEGGIFTPEWTNDTHTAVAGGAAKITTADYLVKSGKKIGRLHYGASDGKIYEEDSQFVDDPLGEGFSGRDATFGGATAFVGTALITTPHYFGPNGPGGQLGEGNKLARYWSYVVSEVSAWTVRVWAGDEWAVPNSSGESNGITPLTKDNVVASQIRQFDASFAGTTTWAPKVVHVHPVPVKADARGWTFEYVFTNPVMVQFLGVGLVAGPGNIKRYPRFVSTAG